MRHGGALILDNQIHIPQQLWAELNANKTKQEIKDLIIDSILSNDLPLPYVSISEKEAKEDFVRLQEFDSLSQLKKDILTTRYNYKFPLSRNYIDSKSVGSKSSNFFHQESRWLCDSINAPSPYRTWTTAKFLNTLFNSLWTLKFNQITSKELRSAIGLRKYIASQFRPASAKTIYELFNSRKVLDFSMGWGDRLAAFHACQDTRYYFGIDPNSRLHAGYQKQNEFYNTGKMTKFIDSPAEEVDIPESSFDTVFTSPPYFNIERYSQCGKQSFKRYKTVDSWLSGFLFPVLTKSVKALQPKGYLVINISDVYSGHKINRICDPMNEFLGSFPELKRMSTLGLRMAKRPKSLAAESSCIFIEPVWVYQRTMYNNT